MSSPSACVNGCAIHSRCVLPTRWMPSAVARCAASTCCAGEPTVHLAFAGNCLADEPHAVGRNAFAPDVLALALVFWNVHQPRRVGMGAAFVFGLLMDVHEGALFGQHALAYTIVSTARSRCTVASSGFRWARRLCMCCPCCSSRNWRRSRSACGLAANGLAGSTLRRASSGPCSGRWLPGCCWRRSGGG